MKILKDIEFDNVYAFKYSARPYTRSAQWPDDVPPEEKTERIEELLVFQKKMSFRKYQEDLNQNVEVMLEGFSKSNSDFWTGRTRKNRVVHIAKDPAFAMGQILNVKITETHTSWMVGKVIDDTSLLSMNNQLSA
jgi:tRNA-2-methylthio-N6-dimethylallyladenosine synthase